jgi:plasmid stabilization system protein ParE
MDWHVGLTERAYLDLEQVTAFLARKNVAAAERLGLKLVDTIFSLEQMPFRGVTVRGRPGYRRILHRPWFLIFYRINEARHSIEIVRVWDGRQDPAIFALN